MTEVAQGISEIEFENANLKEYVKWLEKMLLNDPNSYKDMKFEIELQRRNRQIDC